jgi:S-DNA-T family DNA segregation ATPase FtsK/SpoIIIE
MIDMLERRGVISGYEGSKPRQVLITEADLPRVLDETGMRARGERLPASSGLESTPAHPAATVTD